MQVRNIIWNKLLGRLLVVAAGLCFEGCITPFGPPAAVQSSHFLVVEGFINTSQGATQILLTRTRTLSDTSQPIAETGAHVSVEDGLGNDFPLTETGSGNYVLSSLGSDTTGEFRLRIQTSNGEQYLSDFDTAARTPPIDSVAWALNGDGVQILVNTHDPAGLVKYYLWNYQETWEFHSYYATLLQYTGGQVVARPMEPEIYTCWRSDSSTNILLATTTGISEDIVSGEPLVLIPYHSNEISVEYSILVNQRGLSQTAYLYWSNLQKNSEQLGTIFDPQPFTATGNIHSLTNPDEQVIGFVGAGTQQQERIFISNASMPQDWTILPNCPQVVVPSDSTFYYFGIEGYVPTSQDGNTAYFGSEATCVICTLTGTNVVPSFWP